MTIKAIVGSTPRRKMIVNMDTLQHPMNNDHDLVLMAEADFE